MWQMQTTRTTINAKQKQTHSNKLKNQCAVETTHLMHQRPPRKKPPTTYHQKHAQCSMFCSCSWRRAQKWRMTTGVGYNWSVTAWVVAIDARCRCEQSHGWSGGAWVGVTDDLRHGEQGRGWSVRARVGAIDDLWRHVQAHDWSVTAVCGCHGRSVATCVKSLLVRNNVGTRSRLVRENAGACHK